MHGERFGHEHPRRVRLPVVCLAQVADMPMLDAKARALRLQLGRRHVSPAHVDVDAHGYSSLEYEKLCRDWNEGAHRSRWRNPQASCFPARMLAVPTLVAFLSEVAPRDPW